MSINWDNRRSPLNPCKWCKARVGNDGIPAFYASTESDSTDHIYPAKIVCNQCGAEVRCGRTYESAATEWNNEMTISVEREHRGKASRQEEKRD